MVLARRLLIAGSGGSFTPSPTAWTLTAAPHGGWTQIPAPKGIEHNGVLYFGVVNGTSGDIELYAYTIATSTIAGPTVMRAALGIDTHEAPAIEIRSDGRIICAYSGHNDVTHLYVWISTNPEDISTGTETNIDSQFTSDTYTYPIFAWISTTLYLFVRSVDTGTSTSYLQMSTSTDDGDTWAAHTDVFAQAGERGYWKITGDGSRFDIAISDDGAVSGLGSVYHFYYDGTWRRSDGTSMGSPTFDYSDLTLVYNTATAGPAWPLDIYSGTNPRIVYSNSISANADSQWRYARWDGSSWDNATVLASIGFGVVDPSPVAAIDALNLSKLYAVVYVSGQHQLWRFSTADNGATWDAGTLIAGGAIENIYPTSVKDHTSGSPAILWLYGDYTGAETAFDLGVKAIAA
jgi:hypothetical protein